MEVTIYNLVGPLGVVYSYTDREEAEKEAEKRFILFKNKSAFQGRKEK